jgi:hypothetical protein
MADVEGEGTASDMFILILDYESVWTQLFWLDPEHILVGGKGKHITRVFGNYFKMMIWFRTLCPLGIDGNCTVPSRLSSSSQYSGPDGPEH